MTEAIALIHTTLRVIVSPEGATVAWLLLALSEALGSLPQVKANSVYQAVTGFLRWLNEKMRGKLPWHR